jgi:cytochrome P450
MALCGRFKLNVVLPVVALFSFGEPFGTVSTGKTHFAIPELAATMRIIYPLGEYDLDSSADQSGTNKRVVSAGYVPWLARFLQQCIPDVIASRARFHQFCLQRLQERRRFGSQRKDLFSLLLGEEDENGSNLSNEQLHAECVTAVIAGSDTRAAAITCTWYLLLRNPHAYSRLKVEIDALFPNMEVPADATKLATQALYLNAVINEAMRLFPPGASGPQRTAPSDGLVILDNYVPAGTMISVPTATVHRDARYFSHPDEFLPERWLNETKREGVLNMNAFIPFSIGPVRFHRFAP